MTSPIIRASGSWEYVVSDRVSSSGEEQAAVIVNIVNTSIFFIVMYGPERPPVPRVNDPLSPARCASMKPGQPERIHHRLERSANCPDSPTPMEIRAAH